MRTYLVTFRPMGSFSFGSDRHFQFKGRVGATDRDFDPYYIKTNPLPEQSTLFGALRFHILQQEGLIDPTFSYTDEDKRKMDDLVGSSSFSFDENSKGQTFGKIESMSPLFILDEKNNKLVPNPFNNKNKVNVREQSTLSPDECNGLPEIDGKVDKTEPFSPIELKSGPYCTSLGAMYLPKEGEYIAKEGYASGFYRLKVNGGGSVALVDEGNPFAIFKQSVLTGNAIPKDSSHSNEDGLFKREVYQMKKGYRFAVYVRVADDLKLKLETSFVSMGQKGSLFQVEVEEQADNLISDVRNYFASHTPKGMTWHYCLSDCLLDGTPSSFDFAIIEEKAVKLLQTDWSKGSHLKGISRQVDEITLCRAGSVLYGSIGNNVVDSAYDVAGYQQIIKINGTKE